LDNLNIEAIVTEGGKEYIAGFIAKKFIISYPELSRKGAEEKSNNFWVATLSKGGLIEPSMYWCELFCKFEEFFTTIHGRNSICKEPNVVKKIICVLSERFTNENSDFLKCYCKMRVLIRIKHLSKRLEDEKFIQQAKRRRVDNTGGF